MTIQESDFGISLVRDDLLFRLQRRIGLIPEQGFGILRRVLFFSMLSWLPIALWAIFTGRALPESVGEPLLQHFGIHVRFLFAVPLLIIGEGMAHGLTHRLIPHFTKSGLVQKQHHEAFREILRGTARLRDSTLPWVVIAALIAAILGVQPPSSEEHELVWASVGNPATFQLGFGGWWMA
jgi:hypothetical protein